MTNVRCFRRKNQLPTSLHSVCGETARVEDRRRRLRATSVVFGVTFLLIACVWGETAHAQNSAAFGTSPSGSAEGTFVDSNRDGLGFSARMGHEAGNTVGRNDSASLFQFSPYVNIGNGFAFGDSRLTYANDGGLAWSFGGGYRHFVTAWDAVIGGYAYIDRDEITGANFKQWSVGGEILADAWEVRGNWYEPTGDTSTQTGTRIDQSSANYSGNNLLFDRIDTFAEALRGFDAEIGFLLPGKFSERFDLRGFGGGYWYEGVGLPGFAGFSTRLQADINDFLELGLKLTDDEVFHTNVSFNATVHFGGFRSQEHTTRSAIQRLAEPVRRNLNIAATVSDVLAGSQVAMVSDGGSMRPLTIAHVDSDQTVAGDGTVDNPFASINQGLSSGADVVFTHADSIFNTAPDNELTLESGKTLFGEGLITFPTGTRETVNTVNIADVGDLILPRSPKFTGTQQRPMLLNSGGTAVTMRNNTTFGGFVIDTPATHGILSENSADQSINDVLIREAGGNGIRFDNPSGNTTIVNTEILSANAGAFVVEGGDATIRYRSSSSSGDLDPAFSNIVNDNGAVVSVQNTTGGAVVLSTTTISDDGGEGIIIGGTAGSPMLGGVTIDNATLLNSTGTGISITDAAGQYIFQNTLRSSTTIDGATADSVNVTRLGATGTVQFGDMMISASGGSGLAILENSGIIDFVGNVAITNPVSVDPFISVSGSTAGSVVAFLSGRSLLLNGVGATGGRAGGTGIQITNNAAGSLFGALGDTDILSVAGRGIDIFSDASTVTFGGPGASDTLNIQEPGLEGLRIFGTTGSQQFTNSTVLTRTAAAVAPSALVDIEQNTGLVFFENLLATDLSGNTGVFLDSNGPGPDNLGKVSFTTLGIATTGATGLLANNNHEIETRFGTITSTGAPAVDILDSGIDIQLEAVNSANSPTFGMRLQNTNRDISDNRGILHPTINKTFRVVGDSLLATGNQLPTIGSGGTITDSTNEGILLIDAGQISLTGMNLDENEYGIRVINDLTDSTGTIRTEDDQFLLVQRTNFIDADVRAIETTNLTSLDVRNSLFDNNGDVATVVNGVLTNETIFADYSQRPNETTTEIIDDFDNPFSINLENNIFRNVTDDTIFIDQQASANDSHLIVTTFNNRFEHEASTPTRAFALAWNGPLAIDLNGDDYSLSGALDFGATGMFIAEESFTDQMLLTVRNVEILETDQPLALGLRVETRVASVINIQDNSFTFDEFTSTGMEFSLGTNTNFAMSNNGLFFGEQEGTGVDFDRIGAGSQLLIQNNQILLFDDFLGTTLRPDDPPNETGMIFGIATGAYSVRGIGNQILEVFPGNFTNPIAPDFISTPTGGNIFRVNGINYP